MAMSSSSSSSPRGPPASSLLRTRCSVRDLKGKEKREPHHLPHPARRRTVADIRRHNVGLVSRQPSSSSPPPPPSATIYDDDVDEDSPIVMLKLSSSPLALPPASTPGKNSAHASPPAQSCRIHVLLADPPPRSLHEGETKKDDQEIHHHKDHASDSHPNDSKRVTVHHEDKKQLGQEAEEKKDAPVGNWSTNGHLLVRSLLKSLEQQFGASSLQSPKQTEEMGDPVVSVLQKSLSIRETKSSSRKFERRKMTDRVRELSKNHNPLLVHKESTSMMRKNLPNIDEDQSLHGTLSKDYNDAYLAALGQPGATESSLSSAASSAEECCSGPTTSTFTMNEDPLAEPPCAWKSQIRVQSQLSTNHVEITLLQQDQTPSLQMTRSAFSVMSAPSRTTTTTTMMMPTRSTSTRFSDYSQLYEDYDNHDNRHDEEDSYPAFTRLRTTSTAGWSRDVSTTASSSFTSWLEEEEGEIYDVGPCHSLAWF